MCAIFTFSESNQPTCFYFILFSMSLVGPRTNRAPLRPTSPPTWINSPINTAAGPLSWRRMRVLIWLVCLIAGSGTMLIILAPAPQPPTRPPQPHGQQQAQAGTHSQAQGLPRAPPEFDSASASSSVIHPAPLSLLRRVAAWFGFGGGNARSHNGGQHAAGGRRGGNHAGQADDDAEQDEDAAVFAPWCRHVDIEGRSIQHAE